MAFRIDVSRSKSAEYSACCERAAREMGLPLPVVATVLSHFLEELGYQLAQGKIVKLPGFGTIGVTTNARMRLRYGRWRRCYARFESSAQLRCLLNGMVDVETLSTDWYKAKQRVKEQQLDRPAPNMLRVHTKLRKMYEQQAEQMGVEIVNALD